MSEAHEREQQLVLKEIFGARLTPEEARELEAFRSTAAGGESERSARDFKRLIDEIGVVRVEPIDARAMVTRLETTLREQGKAFRRRFLPFCLAVYALFALGALVFSALPSPGKSGAGPASLWIVMLGGATVCCVFAFLRMHRLEHGHLYDELAAAGSGRATRTLEQRAGSWLLIALVATLIGLREGWSFAAGFTALVVLGTLALAALARRAVKRSRIREDPELWSWWYGERDRGAS
jgi:hypothetical protein